MKPPPPGASPYREPAQQPAPTPPSHRGRFIAVAAVAVVGGALGWGLSRYAPNLMLGPMPAFTVRLDPCLARPAGPGAVPYITAERRDDHALHTAVVESNGRWSRTLLAIPQMFPEPPVRVFGCVAPEIFAPYFTRLQSPPSPAATTSTGCLVHEDPTGSRPPPPTCERPDLASEILAVVDRLTPATPPPAAPCETSPCEVTLSDGEVPHPHGGGRRHAVSLRRDGTFVCDNDDPNNVVFGTLSPAEPVFRWLTDGLRPRPLEPGPSETFTLYTLSEMRQGETTSTIDYATIEPRWRRIAALLPPWCAVPSPVRTARP